MNMNINAYENKIVKDFHIYIKMGFITLPLIVIVLCFTIELINTLEYDFYYKKHKNR